MKTSSYEYPAAAAPVAAWEARDRTKQSIREQS
jgi:hypothetical protein